MKRSAIPLPMHRTIHSSNVLGGAAAVASATLASTSPARQATWSSLSSADMLFWKG
jgi:hypothetical protein